MKLPISVVLSVILLSVRGVSAQPTEADAACPGLKFEIGVPEDIVRPQSEVLLEMKLTNVTHGEVWLADNDRDFWSYDFELRDAQGVPVPRTAGWMLAISQRPTNVTLSMSTPLAAGESLIRIAVLEELFDLSKPGQYTLRVSFGSYGCSNKVTHVTSNLIHFTVGAPSNLPSTSQAGISVLLSATRARLPVGWAAPLDIVIQNNSSHPLRWAVDNPPNMAPDEFLSGVEVFDAAGKTSPPTKQLDPNWGFSRYWGLSRFRDHVSTVEIPPGKNAEQIISLGDVFDISKAGKYRASVTLWDPISNRRIESNVVSFEIGDTASSRPLPKQPPFIVTLQSAHFDPPDPGNVLICMGNISDHDIRLDDSALKDFVTVEAADGTTAVMNEARLADWNPEKLKQVPAGSEQCCTWQTVKPRKALCGGLKVGVIYNLSKAGAYRVRIDRYDELDATQGQKLGELPIVHSNWLTIFENSPTAPER
ncbi:MAG: hypothetical protein WCC14_05345 [Acidobacteriaceae bacterium]